VQPVFQRPTAPAPAVADTAFNPAHIIGGARAPEYPDSYQDSGRTGRVTVDCVIQTDGRPTGCHVLNAQGGAAFSQAVESWLNGANAPRYKPAIRGGQPQTERHQWVVSFQAPE
jgi:TonB family protein